MLGQGEYMPFMANRVKGEKGGERVGKRSTGEGKTKRAGGNVLQATRARGQLGPQGPLAPALETRVWTREQRHCACSVCAGYAVRAKVGDIFVQVGKAGD